MPTERTIACANKAQTLMTTLLFMVCTLNFIANSAYGQLSQDNGQVTQQQYIPRQGDGALSGAVNQRPLPSDAFLPRPFPELNQEHAAYVSQLLEYWEHSSSQIDMFECQFNRWEYDGVFGPGRQENGQLLPKTVSNGTIKFKGPDKGYFAIEQSWQYTPTTNPEAEPYQEVPRPEKWICDGQFVYQFDFEQENLNKMELPPEQRGERLMNGPLPFLFGARKDLLLGRYWIRCITPESTEGEYWIEVYPKFPSDAQNYHKVVIILDESDFLPKATEIFDPNFNAQTNPTRTVFEFDARKKYKERLIDARTLLDMFGREFFEPRTPRGWQLNEIPHSNLAEQTSGVPSIR